MPIIIDGVTPHGRMVRCKPDIDHVGVCTTRKMTEEERAFYGEANPPSKWGVRPRYAAMLHGTPKKKVVRFADDDDFRKKMKRERLRRNMTQARVAQFAGVSSSEIGKLERGAKPVTAAWKKRVCDVFGWEEEGGE